MIPAQILQEEYKITLTRDQVLQTEVDVDFICSKCLINAQREENKKEGEEAAMEVAGNQNNMRQTVKLQEIEVLQIRKKQQHIKQFN
jgi:hypothetical protein